MGPVGAVRAGALRSTRGDGCTVRARWRLQGMQFLGSALNGMWHLWGQRHILMRCVS